MIRRTRLSKKSYLKDFTTHLWCQKTKRNQRRCGPHRWSGRELITKMECKTQCLDPQISHPRGLMVNTLWKNRGLSTNNRWVSPQWKKLNSRILTFRMVLIHHTKEDHSKLINRRSCLRNSNNHSSNQRGPNSLITCNKLLSTLAIIANSYLLSGTRIHFTDYLLFKWSVFVCLIYFRSNQFISILKQNLPV